MAKNFDIAKANYDRGLWTIEMLAKLVENGRLTTTEYEGITGEPYAG